jgi:hypothetical protein
VNAPDCESLPLDRLRPKPLVVAWRCWYVWPDELVLRPIYRRGLPWKPRQAMVAICPDHEHEPPAEGCKCGIWTVREPQQLEEIHWTTTPPKDRDPLPGVLVVGQVALWGDLIEHERGFRAEYGYPTHLYAFTDDAELAGLLRDRYLVPVEYGERAESLRARLLPDNPWRDPAPVTASVPAPAPRAPAPPAGAKATPLDILIRTAVDPIREKAIRELARERVSSLHWWPTRDIAGEKEHLAGGCRAAPLSHCPWRVLHQVLRGGVEGGAPA